MTYPVFASGDVLNASDMNAVGSWLVKTQTIGSAVSSVTVTDAFSSNYDNYYITVTGGVASTAINLNLTLGATTSGYYFAGIYVQYTSASVTGYVNTNTTSWQAFGRGTTASLNAAGTLFGPNLAKNTHIHYTNTGAATADYYQTIGGYLADTTQYTALTITTSAGTITGGTIRVYGLRN